MSEGRGAESGRPDAVARAHAAFSAAFGGMATHLGSAPGRINLIGEHTDYNGGLVLPAPIGLRCAVAGAVAKTLESRLIATDIDASFVVDARVGRVAPGSLAKGHWASYVLGVIEEYRNHGFDVPPLDVAIASDIPIGAGLSSSAALEAATAALIEALMGRGLEPKERARACRAAEHNFAGVPCGIMDQFAVILGKPGFALLIDCSTEETELVPLPSPEIATILIVDTRVRHALADGEYAKRREACASAAAKCGVKLLCQSGPPPTIKAGLTEEERRCALHVLSENWRVHLAVDALRRVDLAALGSFMFQSHESLRDGYRVSCAELDTVVETARSLPGVYGARMTGAGFGGCAIVLVEAEQASAAADAIVGAFRQKHGTDCRVFAA